MSDSVEKFIELVNQSLPQMPTDEALTTFDSNDEAFIECFKLFEQAYNPSNFYHVTVEMADARLWQAYELLGTTFLPDVLYPKAGYIGFYSQPRTKPQTSSLIARCWKVKGLHQYDSSGRLIRFSNVPFTATENIAAVVSPVCISLEDVGYPGECIGAIGYLATRTGLRMQGHGRKLYQFAEEAIQQMAGENGWKVRLIVLESEPAARPFWYQCGFLYPKDSFYQQPSFDFDASEGIPDFTAVPEMLMVKFAEDVPRKSPPSISRKFLLDVVRAVYERWYVPETGAEPFDEALTNFVIGKLYREFVESITTDDEVLLIPPPK